MCSTRRSNVVQTQMREFEYISLSPHFVGEYKCILKWNELFHLLVRFSNEVFSYCTLTETFAIGF